MANHNGSRQVGIDSIHLNIVDYEIVDFEIGGAETNRCGLVLADPPYNTRTGESLPALHRAQLAGGGSVGFHRLRFDRRAPGRIYLRESRRAAGGLKAQVSIADWAPGSSGNGATVDRATAERVVEDVERALRDEAGVATDLLNATVTRLDAFYDGPLPRALNAYDDLFSVVADGRSRGGRLYETTVELGTRAEKFCLYRRAGKGDVYRFETRATRRDAVRGLFGVSVLADVLSRLPEIDRARWEHLADLLDLGENARDPAPAADEVGVLAALRDEPQPFAEYIRQRGVHFASRAVGGFDRLCAMLGSVGLKPTTVKSARKTARQILARSVPVGGLSVADLRAEILEAAGSPPSPPRQGTGPAAVTTAPKEGNTTP